MNGSEPKLKYCHDYAHLKIDCCFSCHEDQDIYGYELCGVYDKKTLVEIAEVCCSVARAIEEAEEKNEVQGESPTVPS